MNSGFREVAEPKARRFSFLRTFQNGIPTLALARLLWVWVMLAGAGTAAAQCQRGADVIELDIAGFGTAYYRNIRTDRAADLAELYGDVCITSAQGQWTLLADRVRFVGLSSSLHLEVDMPTVILPDWRIAAKLLTSDGKTLVLEESTLVGSNLQGSAEQLVIDLASGEVSLVAVRAVGPGFRMEGSTGSLQGSTLMLEEVVATTCTCLQGPLYQVTGSSAVFDLDRGNVVIRDGTLDLSGVTVDLQDELELSSTGAADIALPLNIEYVADSAAGDPGSGLGIVVPSLPLTDRLTLEAGLIGLDRQFPFRAFALLRYQDPMVNFEIGRARGGLRADFSLRRELTSWLVGLFAVRNRHEPAEDFLHEGTLALEAHPAALSLAGFGKLETSARLEASASSQMPAAARVSGVRLGVATGIRYTSPLTPVGRLELPLDLQATSYPDQGAFQYGIALRPAWRFGRGPFTASLEYDRLFTNSASPFSEKLDRLEPSNRLLGTFAVRGPLSPGWRGGIEIRGDYDLSIDPSGIPAGFDSLAVGSTLDYAGEAFSLSFAANLQLAALLAGEPLGERQAGLGASVEFTSSPLDFGLRFHYDLDPREAGLDSLEVSASLPIRSQGVKVTPFLALDFAPSLRYAEPPRIAGHGLELEIATCCGTILLGYRQRDNVFSTSFGVRFEN